MKLVVVGYRDFSKHILRHLSENWEVVGAIGEEPSEKVEQSGYESLRDITRGTEIDFIETADINDYETIESLRELEPDLCVCAGWTQIVSGEVLEIPNNGFLGLHSSRLPEGRGGAPVNWSIINDEDEAWMSLFHFTPEIDDGDVIKQVSVPIQDRDDVKTVYNKLTRASFELLDSVLDGLARGESDAKKQDRGKATYRPNRKPEDGIIDWRSTARQLFNWVRALTRPYPGAFTFYEEEKLVVWRAGAEPDADPKAEPGEVMSVDHESGIKVATTDGVITLERVQVGAEPDMWGDDFARERDVETGDVLGKPTDYPEWRYTGIRGYDEPTVFETNVDTGHEGRVDAVVFSNIPEDSFRIIGSFDGDTIHDTVVQPKGWHHETVSYEPLETGVHTLKLSFKVDDETVDNRFLKVFSAR